MIWEPVLWLRDAILSVYGPVWGLVNWLLPGVTDGLVSVLRSLLISMSDGGTGAFISFGPVLRLFNAWVPLDRAIDLVIIGIGATGIVRVLLLVERLIRTVRG